MAQTRNQLMEWIMEYIWAPFLIVVAAGWKMLHRHDKEIGECQSAQEGLTEAVDEARTSRKEIYDKIETVRTELTEQHTTIRKEQREDFKEIRELIGGMSK